MCAACKRSIYSDSMVIPNFKEAKRVGSPEDMREFAADFAQQMPAKQLVFLSGDLGAGKTTFCQGFLHGLGHEGPVLSPTYGLVESYHLQSAVVHHFDLYRLDDPESLEWIGLRDYLAEDAIVLIEWPERALACLPEPDVVLRFTYCAEEVREVEVG